MGEAECERFLSIPTIISFTGAVCLRTISFALVEEESADECSCLLSVRSRAKGTYCTILITLGGGGCKQKIISADQNLQRNFLHTLLLEFVSAFVITFKEKGGGGGEQRGLLKTLCRCSFHVCCCCIPKRKHTRSARHEQAGVSRRGSSHQSAPPSLCTAHHGCRAAGDAARRDQEEVAAGNFISAACFSETAVPTQYN